MTTQFQTPVPEQPARPREESVDAVIIGAGQAGLATAFHLSRAGVGAVVLDENARVGDQWRSRYDSLRLFTPARYDALPGLPFPLPDRSWPTGRQMGDYLEQYADAMGLDVRSRTSVDRVHRDDDDTYLVSAGATLFRTRNVVVATGGEHHPRVPDFAGRLDPGIRQLHSSAYHNPDQLLPGPVLVVGASHSGADLALECAEAGHPTWLAGRGHGQIPIDIEGGSGRLALPFLWFAANHVLTTRTPLGRRLRPEVRSHGAPLIRVKAERLDAAGVHRIPARVTGAQEGLPVVEDGSALEVANVLWCTGFRQDFGFLDLPVVGEDGWPLDDGGVVPSAPGLYFVGLLFQRGFYSMLIGGATRDGAFIARHIAARRSAASRAS